MGMSYVSNLTADVCSNGGKAENWGSRGFLHFAEFPHHLFDLGEVGAHTLALLTHNLLDVAVLQLVSLSVGLHHGIDLFELCGELLLGLANNLLVPARDLSDSPSPLFVLEAKAIGWLHDE